jgi:phospholipase/lecithinase/hemolysin
MIRMFRVLVFAGAVLAAPMWPAAALATPSYSNLFIFGDSLADSGNNALFIDSFVSPPPGPVLRTPTPIADPLLVPSLPYATNRYSNGPVWVEQFAASLNLSALPSLAGGTNYAFGGARIGPAGSSFPFSLTDQVASYLTASGGTASATALYVVEGGSNNARDIISTAFGGGDYVSMIEDYALGVVSIITQLKLAGAENILLWNVPDVSKTPAIQAFGQIAAGQASGLVAAMNTALDIALDALPDPWLSGLHLFDAFSAFNDVFDNPAAYGIADVSSTCASSPACIANPEDTFFWDGVHPTAAGHGVLAAAVLAELPEPSTVLLVACALLGLALNRSLIVNRRRAAPLPRRDV